MNSGWKIREFHRERHGGFAEFRQRIQKYTPEYTESICGVPAQTIRDLARAYGESERAVICWTLGITEHHNAVDNVLGLINLAP